MDILFDESIVCVETNDARLQFYILPWTSMNGSPSSTGWYCYNLTRILVRIFLSAADFVVVLEECKLVGTGKVLSKGGERNGKWEECNQLKLWKSFSSSCQFSWLPAWMDSLWVHHLIFASAWPRVTPGLAMNRETAVFLVGATWPIKVYFRHPVRPKLKMGLVPFGLISKFPWFTRIADGSYKPSLLLAKKYEFPFVL